MYLISCVGKFFNVKGCRVEVDDVTRFDWLFVSLLFKEANMRRDIALTSLNKKGGWRA